MPVIRELGEVWTTLAFVFLDSKIRPLQPNLDCDDKPLVDEPYLTIDWSLPLGAHGQYLLWEKYRNVWDSVTSTIPIASRKRYRYGQDELLVMRNMCALWQQLRPFLEARARNINCVEYELALMTSTSRDDDMQHLITVCPKNVSPSMLPSQKKEATKQVQDQQAQRLTRDYGFHGFIIIVCGEHY